MTLTRPKPYRISRQHRPHLRCGLCDEPIEPGEQTVYVDDERCHERCAHAEEED